MIKQKNIEKNIYEIHENFSCINFSKFEENFYFILFFLLPLNARGYPLFALVAPQLCLHAQLWSSAAL
jgi:hypothetical protein